MHPPPSTPDRTAQPTEQEPAALPAGSVVHASAVAVEDRGLLILGPSGAGKSALALQMIALGAVLIADDATGIEAGADGPRLSCPDAIACRIEARGLGLLRLPVAGPTRARLVLRLAPDAAARLPQPASILLCDVRLPLLTARAASHLASALFLALRHDILPDDIHP
jgi:HPr kinase/phosphorylase